jgi:hypothetical protein
MTGGRRYKDEQITFVLGRVLSGVDSQEIIKEFKKTYNAPGFGKSQLKYIKNTYGDHPDFG